MDVSVYILHSALHGCYYVGMTNDRERRLRQHNKGLTRSIAGANDWRLVYHEDVGDTKAGRVRERAIKARGARRFLETIHSAPAPPAAG